MYLCDLAAQAVPCSPRTGASCCFIVSPPSPPPLLSLSLTMQLDDGEADGSAVMLLLLPRATAGDAGSGRSGRRDCNIGQRLHSCFKLDLLKSFRRAPRRPEQTGTANIFFYRAIVYSARASLSFFLFSPFSPLCCALRCVHVHARTRLIIPSFFPG